MKATVRDNHAVNKCLDHQIQRIKGQEVQILPETAVRLPQGIRVDVVPLQLPADIMPKKPISIFAKHLKMSKKMWEELSASTKRSNL